MKKWYRRGLNIHGMLLLCLQRSPNRSKIFSLGAVLTIRTKAATGRLQFFRNSARAFPPRHGPADCLAPPLPPMSSPTHVHYAAYKSSLNISLHGNVPP